MSYLGFSICVSAGCFCLCLIGTVKGRPQSMSAQGDLEMNTRTMLRRRAQGGRARRPWAIAAVAAACALGSGAATAAPLPAMAQITEARWVAAPALGPLGLVCSGYDSSVCADVRHHYQQSRRHLLQVGLVAAMTPQWALRLRYTEGVSAPKASLQPRLLIGLIGSQPMGGARSLTAEVYTTVGGDLVHRPCLDAYDRRYHCGTLTAWEDFPGKRVKSSEYGLRLAYRF